MNIPRPPDWLMFLVVFALLMALAVKAAHADPCVVDVRPRMVNGPAQTTGTFSLAPAPGLDHVVSDNPGGFFTSPLVRDVNPTFGNCATGAQLASVTQEFNQRFDAVNDTITRAQNRAISMAMAVGGMGNPSAGQAPGKAVAAAGFGVSGGTVSLSAAIGYTVNKRLGLSSGVAFTPGVPGSAGFFGSATLLLN